MNETPKPSPAWLQYGLPFVIIAGGIVTIIRREFFMAGGSRGGTSKMSGETAVIAGAVMIVLGVCAFWLFRRIGKKSS